MASFEFTKNQRLALILLVGIALIGLAYGRLRGGGVEASKQSSVTVTQPSASGNIEIQSPVIRPDSPRTASSIVTVHVAGCVKNPSVYKLPLGSRIVDAIHLAGGPKPDANLDAINLAAEVKDGQQILVPAKQVAISMLPYSASKKAVSSNTTGHASMDLGSAIVNINTAGVNELDNLPGVGPATAQKIIDYRNSIGQFTSIDQLEEVKGIGPSKLEQMRPYIRL